MSNFKATPYCAKCGLHAHDHIHSFTRTLDSNRHVFEESVSSESIKEWTIKIRRMVLKAGFHAHLDCLTCNMNLCAASELVKKLDQCIGKLNIP